MVLDSIGVADLGVYGRQWSWICGRTGHVPRARLWLRGSWPPWTFFPWTICAS